MLTEAWQRFLDFLCLFFLQEGWTRYPIFLYGKWYTSDEKAFHTWKEALQWERSHNNIHYKGFMLNTETHHFEWVEDYYE